MRESPREIPAHLYQDIVAAADCATLAPGLYRVVYGDGLQRIAPALTRADAEGVVLNMHGQQPVRGRMFVVGHGDVRELDAAASRFVRVQPLDGHPRPRHRLSPLAR